MWLLAAFIAVPLIEIALFIQVGGLIGLWPTLGIVLLTAILGTALVRSQGAEVIAQLRGSLNELRDPTEPIAHGAMILLAGALLLTPGFFTDAVGFLLLTPPVRLAVMRYLAKHVKVERFSVGRDERAQPHGNRHRESRHDARGDVIDADFHEVDADTRPDQPPSGWTRH